MLTEILGVYLLSLLVTSLIVLFLAALWIFVRAVRNLDKTKAARQSILMDALMMSLIAIPVLSFAVMAIILMAKA